MAQASGGVQEGIRALLDNRYDFLTNPTKYVPIYDDKGHIIGHVAGGNVLNSNSTPHVSKNGGVDYYSCITLFIAKE